MLTICFFFFNDTATTEIYTLSLHDALPIYPLPLMSLARRRMGTEENKALIRRLFQAIRSEEHTSELQSLAYLVCRLLLEKKKQRLNECRADASHIAPTIRRASVSRDRDRRR